MNPHFDAKEWKSGQAGFGNNAPGFVRHTRWTTADIWLHGARSRFPGAKRRTFEFYVYHDDDVEIYVNGIPAAQEGGLRPST